MVVLAAAGHAGQPPRVVIRVGAPVVADQLIQRVVNAGLGRLARARAGQAIARVVIGVGGGGGAVEDVRQPPGRVVGIDVIDLPAVKINRCIA